MAKIEMICHCGAPYPAREADLKRGWARACGKSCAAKVRDFGKPKGVRADGIKIKQTAKKPSSYRPNDSRAIDNDAVDWEGNGWDAHKCSF